MAMNAVAMTKGLERNEWLKLRTKGIGGSDAAAVAGMSKWKSPVSVFLEKTGQIEPEEAGEAAYWGTVLEDVVAKEFSNRTGLKIQRSNKLYRHPEHHFMIGNVDRIITDKDRRKGILECKTTSAFKAEDWEGDRIPDHYMIQLQHYLSVLGLEFGFFAVLIGGNRFEYRYVERNEGIINSLIKIEQEFWEENVMKVVPPLVDGSDASTDLLGRLYPESNPDTSIILPEEAGVIIEQLKEAQWEVKQADERLELYKNQLKALIQDNEVAFFKGEKVATWKSNDTTSLDTKALKAAHPEIYNQFAVTKSVRRFLVK